MKKKYVFFISIILFFISSCQLASLFKQEVIVGGDVSKFIQDGFSMPVFDDYIMKGDLSRVNGKDHFQLDSEYKFIMAIVNPGELKLNYTLRTNKPEVFYSISGDVVGKGSFKSVNKDIALNFKLKPEADKNDVEFSLEVASNMRSYDTPDISTIRVNQRPSKILPKKDHSNDIEGNIWEPVIGGDGTATIYWDYNPAETDNDVTHIEILHSINENKGHATINYDSLTEKFGNNDFTLTGVPAGADINFSITVYDNEGLGSGSVATGNFVPERAPAPVFTRETGDNINKVTISAESGTTLFVKIDDEDFTEVTSGHQIDLSIIHTIKAYTTKPGLFDSIIESREYTAKYKVTYTSTEHTSGAVPIDNGYYNYNSSYQVLGNTGSLVGPEIAPLNAGIKQRFTDWSQDGSTYTPGESFTIPNSDVIFTASYTTDNNAVRKIGPAGGIVFYDQGNNTDGWRYMEVGRSYGGLPAAGEEWTNPFWSNLLNQDLGTTEIAIGTGKHNSLKIVTQEGHTDSAAKRCFDLEDGGFNDWFLPSNEELQKVGDSIHAQGLGDFGWDYWTSTESHKKWFGPDNTHDPVINTSKFNGFDVNDRERGAKFAPIRVFRSLQPTYAVLYLPNGGTGTAPNDQNHYEANETFTVLNNTFTPPENMVLASWNTDPNGTETSYAPGNATMPENNLVLYAVWKNRPGSLDTTFNTGSGVNNGLNHAINTIVTREGSDKILVGGLFTAYDDNTDHENLIRLNLDGSVDTSFINGGPSHKIDAIAFQGDDILIGGSFTSYDSNSEFNRLARLTPYGDIDMSFNKINPSGNVSAIVVNGNKIFFGSAQTTPGGQIKRLELNGTNDNSFNPTQPNSPILAIAVQNDSKVLIGGGFTNYGTAPNQRNYLARLNNDGSLDTTFEINLTGAVRTMVKLDDGSILVGGVSDPKLFKIKANGEKDNGFPHPEINGIVYAIAVQDDNKILIGGAFTSVDNTTRNRIARLNADGTLDTSFNPGNGSTSTIKTIAIQSDGKILIGGAFLSYDGTNIKRIARIWD